MGEDKPKTNDPEKNSGKLNLQRLNPAEAIDLLTREATWGNEGAAYMLAVIYETGTAVKPDAAQARAWLRRAVSLKPGTILARAASDCVHAAAELDHLLAEGLPLNALAERLATLGRLAERLRMAIGFAQVQASDVDSPA